MSKYLWKIALTFTALTLLISSTTLYANDETTISYIQGTEYVNYVTPSVESRLVMPVSQVLEGSVWLHNNILTARVEAWVTFNANHINNQIMNVQHVRAFNWTFWNDIIGVSNPRVTTRTSTVPSAWTSAVTFTVNADARFRASGNWAPVSNSTTVMIR